MKTFEIVNLISCQNPVLKSWLANRGKRKYRTTYMSPQSQNEFAVLLGEEIQQIIKEKVRKSRYCSVEQSPDVSHTDQLLVVVRLVDPDSLKPEERLICIKKTYDKTGEKQAKDIVDCSNSTDVPLTVRKYSFRRTTRHPSMSGVYNGAHRNPRAFYTINKVRTSWCQSCYRTWLQRVVVDC